MKTTASLTLPIVRGAIVLGALAAAVGAQGRVGEKLPAPNLEGFANTDATAFGDFAGRAVLLEFFAYW